MGGFVCARNADIQDFIVNKACVFERDDTCRTHLIFDDERDDFDLLGYFSLATKQIVLSTNVSNTQAKKMRAKPGERSVKAFLIGQLGKNSAISNNPIDLSVIFEEAYNAIEVARRQIGGRTVILECENVKSLVDLYQANGFKYLQTDEDGTGLVTMYAILP